MTRRHGRRAIGLGLLVPGLLLAHAGGAAAADNRPTVAPPKKTAPRTAASAERRAGHDGRITRAGRTVHVVRPGDSLSRIAVRYGVTRKLLIDANRLAHPEKLRIGHRLVVPGARPGAGQRPATLVDAVLDHGDVLLVRAGPRRVPTRLFVASPEFGREGPDFVWPVDGQVISPFGRRRNGWHAGMDIKAEIGTPILAAAPGVVISSGQERAYGHVVRIEHDGGFVTLYAHNLENFVEVDDRVSAGTIIAIVGRSGSATTPHLHFEVRHEGMVYNPLHLLPARELVEVRADEAPDVPTESARAQAVDAEDDE